MKYFILFLTCILIFSNTYSNTNLNEYLIAKDDNTLNIADTVNKHVGVSYKLYPTQNMWTFIKLNTRNGRMWLVQYSLDDSSRFETYLNLIPLVEKEKERNGRFNLYPTENMWTFILLDQLNGKLWQVQWSGERKNIGVWPID